MKGSMLSSELVSEDPIRFADCPRLIFRCFLADVKGASLVGSGISENSSSSLSATESVLRNLLAWEN